MSMLIPPAYGLKRLEGLNLSISGGGQILNAEFSFEKYKGLLLVGRFACGGGAGATNTSLVMTTNPSQNYQGDTLNQLNTTITQTQSVVDYPIGYIADFTGTPTLQDHAQFQMFMWRYDTPSNYILVLRHSITGRRHSGVNVFLSQGSGMIWGASDFTHLYFDSNTVGSWSLLSTLVLFGLTDKDISG